VSSRLVRPTSRLTRRCLLGAGLAGATWAGLRALPGARAAGPAAARRLLIINLSGAVRSSAAFHAAPDNAAQALAHNPWGTIAGAAADQLSLGQLLDDHLRSDAPAGAAVLPPGTVTTPLPDSAYLTSATGGWKGARLPRLRELADFSVVGTWHEERGDHARAAIEEPSGSSTGAAPGLLTRLGAGLAAQGSLPVPGFHVAPAARFGGGEGDIGRFVPVTLDSVYSLPGAGDVSDAERAAIGHDWAADEAMRDRLDGTRLEGREGYARHLLEDFASHRRTNRALGARLAEPWMHVDNADGAAAFGTVTLDDGSEAPLDNAMLHELAALAGGVDPYGYPLVDEALSWMLGVRLLQLGSPAVTVEMRGFDLHSGEVDGAPALYATLGRLWATLAWLLGRMREPGGDGTMLDHTLVVTMSDFGRDRGSYGGFNGGEGSDHGVDPSCYYLAHAVMGAGVVGNRVLGAAPLDTFDARGPGAAFAPRQLLATLLAALGLDHRAPLWGFDDVTHLVPLWG
jgi:hypothetical protein